MFSLDYLKPIRILAKVDKIWIHNPNPIVVHPLWDLWVVGGKSLCEWDPWEWEWLPIPYYREDNKPISILKYFV